MRRLLALVGLLIVPTLAAQDALVLQTDFGLSEGSVAEMKGVAFTVSRTTPIFDLTHNIPAFDIFERVVLSGHP
jgi:S-adenosylmethionine hydrolase